MSQAPDVRRAAALASRCLEKLEMHTLPVRPLEILRRCRHTAVYTYQQAAEHMNMEEDAFERRYGHADAFTIRGSTPEGERAYIVCYRAGGHPSRQNFTLAHELGHMVLGHQGQTIWEETEADCFAQHLLCPERALKTLQEAGEVTVNSLARACFISKTAAKNILAQQNFFEKNF